MPEADDAGPAAGLAMSRRVISACRAAGFAAAGICRARPSDRADELARWLAEGRHGTMDYLARDAAVRADPARLLAGVRSIIVVADLYAAPGAPDAGEPAHAPTRPPAGTPADAPAGPAASAPSPTPRVTGRVARYAQGRDYHRVIKRRLFALADDLRARFGGLTRVFTDIEPVLEREHAQRAGLGWIGKHTLLIDARHGSYTLLGGILTTLDLPEPPAREQPVHPDACGTCTRCIDACPTGAITPYRVDASRCISYLTIEHRGPIEPRWHAPIGDWLFGCDVCQEVCPYNAPRPGRATAPARAGDAGAAGPPSPQPEYAPTRPTLDALWVLDWGPAQRGEALSGSVLKRATLAMLKRNALIVLGNALANRPDAAALARVRALAEDPGEPALVRRTARDVLERLGHALR